MTALQALLTSCLETLVAHKAACITAVQVSQRHADAYFQQLSYKKANMQFVEGHIEYLDKAGIADKSFDLVISNCVVNLSPDKKRVLQEAYRVLANGGEFYFSDVYCDRRLPQHVKDHEVIRQASMHTTARSSLHTSCNYSKWPCCDVMSCLFCVQHVRLANKASILQTHQLGQSMH